MLLRLSIMPTHAECDPAMRTSCGCSLRNDETTTGLASQTDKEEEQTDKVKKSNCSVSGVPQQQLIVSLERQQRESGAQPTGSRMPLPAAAAAAEVGAGVGHRLRSTQVAVMKLPAGLLLRARRI